ncbi:ABC transporter substrate-binding protein [Aeromicrobium sp. A1-2]|uniref:MCE family protein n=1 Tax=Aeromicrobium sp. A1-2 TaxID=2107713 RepID=UPI000E4806AA|nr:MlaD family protein [Aeromicrobium sp. A1-2]AXT84362.1 ABC transporter substrate-binding protein [Aeromicrobium sp. A1-2]
MRKGIKFRLMAFALLSAVGIVYIGSSYLGVVDRLLGRGYTVHVLLPASGGLFEGSEVTYRGVKIGKVSQMVVEDDGLRVDVALQEGTRVPRDSPVSVDNLTAVGEQYLSFEPDSKQGPMLKDGDVVRGTKDSLPVAEEDLLQNLNRFISSVDGDDLNTVVGELGTMFGDNASPLRSMIDSTQLFVEAAIANEAPTIDLIRNGRTVLQTQADNSANIRAFARDLADLTDTLATSDSDFRKILKDAAPAADELNLLVTDLRTLLPEFLDPMISLSKLIDARLPALEQLLVTFPRLVAVGPSALSPGVQKFGRVHLNLNQDPPPCTQGYLPAAQWRATSKESYVPYYPAECSSGAPVNMRGMKYAPAPVDWRSQLIGGEE